MRLSRFAAAGFGGAALFILIACSPADDGPPITAEGAAKIVAGIEEGMAFYFPDAPGMSYAFEGEVTAVPADDHYLVTLPRMVILDEDGAGKMDFGAATAKVVPNADGTYQFDAKLADRFTITGQDGTETMAMTIGSQSLTGKWLPELMSTIDYEGKLENIAAVVVGPKGTAQMALASMTASSKTTPPKDGLIDVDGAVGLTGLSIASSDGGKMTLESMEMDFDIGGMDLPKVMEATKRFQALQMEMMAEPMDDPSPEMAERMFTMLGEALTAYGDRFSYTMNVGGLAIEGDQGQVRLDRMTSGLSMASEGEFGTGGTQFGFSGLSISPPPPGPAGVIPTAVNVDIRADRIPMEAAKRIFGDFMRAAASAGGNEAAGQAAGQMMAMQLMGAFSQVGTQIDLADLSITTPASALTGKGGMSVDQTAAMGVTADYTITVKNLDATIKALSPGPGQQPSQEIMGGLMMMGMLQGLGRAGTAEDGAPTLTFDIKVSQQGQVLLNGNDMSALMGAMQQGR